MKKETKDKKSTKTSWIGKTATTAAMVAALGISLGVNVQKVYGSEEIQNSGVVQDKHKDWIESQQGKIKSQQIKQGKINPSKARSNLSILRLMQRSIKAR